MCPPRCKSCLAEIMLGDQCWECLGKGRAPSPTTVGPELWVDPWPEQDWQPR